MASSSLSLTDPSTRPRGRGERGKRNDVGVFSSPGREKCEKGEVEKFLSRKFPEIVEVKFGLGKRVGS